MSDKGQPKTSFHVYHIDYRDDAISELVIVDNDKNVVYDMTGVVKGRQLMDAASPRWAGMIGAIKAGTYTIEKCKTDFFLSSYYENLLKEILTNELL